MIVVNAFIKRAIIEKVTQHGNGCTE